MIHKKIYSFINQNDLINENDSIIVAVSAGPDSMYLLYFLLSIKEKYKLHLAVAHVNHHTRGHENSEEAKLVRDFCESHQVAFYEEDFHYEHNDNFHEQARTFRYHFFIELANKLHANKIAIAHHEDDQVETILFKLARGNHLGGYLGMKSIYKITEQIEIIRPLLGMTKKEILMECEENKIPYALDSSNVKNTYTRNHIRNKIIPLYKDIQPDFNQKIIQFQEQLGEAVDFLQENVQNMSEEMIISSEKDRIILDLNLLKRTHIALIRLILLNVIKELTNNKLELTYEKIKNIISIIHNQNGNTVFDLGKDVYCIKEYDHLIFQHGLEETKEYKIEIQQFGEYELPNGMKIRVKKVQEKAKINNKSIILCYNSTIWPLVIRSRENGDSIKLKIGHKKVNRIFIDKKIPVHLRKSWPLLVDQNGVILWVIGLQKSNLDDGNCKEYILLELI